VLGWTVSRLAAGLTPGSQPPPLTPGRLLTQWEPSWPPALAVAVVAGLYVLGVRQLQRRGDRWPVGRSISFLGLGLGTVVLCTESSLAAYDEWLFSVHMVQHMVLSILTPVFLALGAPVTLALRTLPRRARGWLLGALHSRLAAVATFPLVAAVLYVGTPWTLYFSGWYEATLRNPLLHDLNHLHFVVVGCLWFWPLLGVDPMPRRLSYPLRLLAVFATLPFHAWLGVAIMSMTSLIAGDWYLGLHRGWGPAPLTDQNIAGGIMWASGDLVALVILGVLFVQWARDSEREGRREDRRQDRLSQRGQAGTPAAWS